MSEKSEPESVRVQREMRRLMRSMDFIARNYLHPKKGEAPGADRFYEVYQQLGMAWQFLGLQCRHWRGFRRAREGRKACRICGLVQGVEESWILLPRHGPKWIGRMIRPTRPSKRKSPGRVFPSKKAATILADGIDFHGAHLKVDVTNEYESRLFDSKHPITIAADRIVTLQDRGVECYLDDYLVCVRSPEREQIGPGKRYGGFPGELPRKLLRRFPVIFDYDERGRMLGLSILKPLPAGRGKRRGPRTAKRNRAAAKRT